ncbi:MAG: EAL domain-containing protein [Rhodospirillales bacterium]|nr:EAL domain-containing protein [Rhodospirillales bacterium]MDP6646168.1 EAL domain-containing protein [Rhodospirillales bacterium]MDP6843444.1 EAL domain-containing protein [Rhodospirillales bacterium]
MLNIGDTPEFEGPDSKGQVSNEDLEKELSRLTGELAFANETLRKEVKEREKTERENTELAKFPEENPNPVMRCSQDGTLLYANQSSRFLLNIWETAVGRRLPLNVSVIVGEVFHRATPQEMEIAAGNQVYSLLFQPVADSGYVYLYARDITARIEAKQSLIHLAHHDDLTGLPNRRLFQDRLESAISHAKLHGGLGAVHLIDLDHFKDINDSEGHATGDALLKVIADRLCGCLRESDTVARLGGDEFAVIQADVKDLSEIAGLANSILHQVSLPENIDGHSVYPTASIGLSVFPDDGDSTEQVLRGADTALYRAKAKGRATYSFFERQMHRAVKRRKAIERDLRSAIDAQEFVLHYQPKLDLSSGLSLAAEALIRWDRPGQGFLSPAEFIPVAEKSKLIVPIGSWTLAEALRQVRESGNDIKVAVNLSAVQFKEDNLVELVRGSLDASGVAPGNLELEITETVAMEDAENAETVFRRLVDLGVSLAIDDFGTGYSSLSYLKQFPVQRIKIDKTFVDDIGSSESADALVRAVVNLGHGFNMKVTAEGVETEEQLAILKDIGCDEIQGYFHSRHCPPMNFRAS